MSIAVGDKLPDVELKQMGRRDPEPVRSLDVLGKGKVVLFGVPGAFTPTCSDHHLPGLGHRAKQPTGLLPSDRDPHPHGLSSAVVDVGDAFLVALSPHDERTGLGVVVGDPEGHDLGAPQTGTVKDAHQSGVSNIGRTSLPTGLEQRPQFAP